MCQLLTFVLLNSSAYRCSEATVSRFTSSLDIGPEKSSWPPARRGYDPSHRKLVGQLKLSAQYCNQTITLIKIAHIVVTPFNASLWIFQYRNCCGQSLARQLALLLTCAVRPHHLSDVSTSERAGRHRSVAEAFEEWFSARCFWHAQAGQRRRLPLFRVRYGSILGCREESPPSRTNEA
jgi:hypothetical protein